MHYYSHNIGDYRRDTSHLSLLEHGAYRQLMDSYYLSERPLPLDHALIMRTHCARTADEMRAIENVLKDFFVTTEEGYIHKRCDVEIESFHSKSVSARESAKARWDRVRAEKEADAMRTHSEGNANHKPRTNNQEPITKADQVQEPLSALSEPKAKRKARLPDQFLVTGAMRQWAAESVPAVELKTETENFCDYWRGQGGTKLDWVATWRTWMRKAQKDSQRVGGRGFTPFNKAADVEASNQAVVEEIIRRQAERTGKPSAQPGELVASADGKLIIEGDFFNAS